MSVPIKCRGKLILYIKNSFFDLLHTTITEIIEKENLEITSNIEALLKKTDQSDYGPGGIIADVADYLKSTEDVLFFANLVRRAIEDQESIGHLDSIQNFYQELLKYAEELKE